MARVLKGPKSDFVYEKRSLGRFFFDAAGRYRNKIFQIDADLGVTETFSSARTRAIRVAIGLKNMGVTSKHVVVTCSKNNVNNTIPSLGALYLGAKIAALDPTLTAKECQHLLSIVRPKVIFVQDSSLSVIENALEIARLTAVIVVIGQHPKHTNLQDFCFNKTDEEKLFEPINVDNKETAIIFFSSGTTGLPKGICLSHYSLINTAKAFLSLKNIDPSYMFHFTSLYWITAAAVLVMSFLTGGCRVLCSNPSPENTLKIFETYTISFCFMAPIYTYQLCSVPNFSKYNLPYLKSILLGGTSMSSDQIDLTRKYFKDTHVQLIYGMTENSGAITSNDFRGNDRNVYKTKKTSCGKVYVDTELKIVDIESRNLLGPNKKGEICYKSPFLFHGYYNLDSSSVFDEDGFFCSGDIGYYDEDEYIYVVDRIKEMFKYRSWHIIPTEIEQALLECPKIKEAVVFGIPHEIDGDHPAAFIILQEESSMTVDEVHAFLKKKVNERQQLRGGVKFTNAILKTSSGKVQRNKMREMFITNSK